MRKTITLADDEALKALKAFKKKHGGTISKIAKAAILAGLPRVEEIQKVTEKMIKGEI